MSVHQQISVMLGFLLSQRSPVIYRLSLLPAHFCSFVCSPSPVLTSSFKAKWVLPFSFPSPVPCDSSGDLLLSHFPSFFPVTFIIFITISSTYTLSNKFFFSLMERGTWQLRFHVPPKSWTRLKCNCSGMQSRKQWMQKQRKPENNSAAIKAGFWLYIKGYT